MKNLYFWSQDVCRINFYGNFDNSSCQIWKLPRLKVAKFGNWQIWKLPKLKIAEVDKIKNCYVVKLLSCDHGAKYLRSCFFHLVYCFKVPLWKLNLPIFSFYSIHTSLEFSYHGVQQAVRAAHILYKHSTNGNCENWKMTTFEDIIHLLFTMKWMLVARTHTPGKCWTSTHFGK